MGTVRYARFQRRCIRSHCRKTRYHISAPEFCPKLIPWAFSRVAQRKRAGPITQRSVDRNHPLLHTDFELKSTRWNSGWKIRPISQCPVKKRLHTPRRIKSIVTKRCHFSAQIWKTGPVRASNPGPRAPEARIIPLDQQASAGFAKTKEGNVNGHKCMFWCQFNCSLAILVYRHGFSFE